MSEDFIIQRVIQRGDVAKYQVTIDHEDFDQQADSFKVILRWGFLNQSEEILKSQMPHDEDGNWFMLFDTDDMNGKIMAECHYFVPDSDIEGGIREEVDRQWLAFVTAEPNPKFQRCCNNTGEPDGHVTYKRVWRGDVNTLYLNLRTSDKEPIKDSEGNQIRVRKEEKDIY